ncbi:MAG: hypothetical protein GAK30_00520 [Paracidovorax wautersii]|uniref:FlxA-like protein n=1 Tax=Paracidovorax wautersii TaxID=1177982 RepID=A0A7V8FRG4_9BURK|nr:MAG: hypothetical protein GAK30_00520 [Paracidovorax wautersii]
MTTISSVGTASIPQATASNTLQEQEKSTVAVQSATTGTTAESDSPEAVQPTPRADVSISAEGRKLAAASAQSGSAQQSRGTSGTDETDEDLQELREQIRELEKQLREKQDEQARIQADRNLSEAQKTAKLQAVQSAIGAIASNLMAALAKLQELTSEEA